MSKSRRIAFGAVCLISLAVFAFYYQKIGVRTREEMLSIYSQITLNDNLDDLRRLLSTNEVRHLKMKQVSSNEVVLFPRWVTRFGNDWILFLNLENSRIASVQIRMLEGRNYRPDKAPPDKSAK